MRARDLGIIIGRGRPGAANAITDVAGVRVGHATIVRGDGPLVVGEGPVRTGVTMIVPHDGNLWTEPLYAGSHRLNGNGELTGLEWIREAGQLGGAIAIILWDPGSGASLSENPGKLALAAGIYVAAIAFWFIVRAVRRRQGVDIDLAYRELPAQ